MDFAEADGKRSPGLGAHVDGEAGLSFVNIKATGSMENLRGVRFA